MEGRVTEREREESVVAGEQKLFLESGEVEAKEGKTKQNKFENRRRKVSEC